MYSVSRVTICLVFLWAHVSSTKSPIKITTSPELVLNPEYTKSSAGKVFEARQCGGPGQFVEWRVQGCETVDIPCQLAADGTVRLSELDFQSSTYIEKSGLRIIVLLPERDPFTIFDAVIPNGTFTENTLQTARISGSIDEEDKGLMLRVQMVVYNVANNVTEVCAEAAYEFV